MTERGHIAKIVGYLKQEIPGLDDFTVFKLQRSWHISLRNEVDGVMIRKKLDLKHKEVE